MRVDGRYIHLSTDPAPDWMVARGRATTQNREQVQRNAIAKRLRRVARATEDYAKSLETGQLLEENRCHLVSALKQLDKERALQAANRG